MSPVLSEAVVVLEEWVDHYLVPHRLVYRYDDYLPPEGALDIEYDANSLILYPRKKGEPEERERVWVRCTCPAHNTPTFN